MWRSERGEKGASRPHETVLTNLLFSANTCLNFEHDMMMEGSDGLRGWVRSRPREVGKGIVIDESTKGGFQL